MNTKDWNPDAYLNFGNERTQPSIDLVNRIRTTFQPRTIIDIGCGPGNSSKVLMDRWPDARLVGIDSSPGMIERAKRDFPAQEWLLADAAEFSSTAKFDVVFSNATIQWIPDHEKLLKTLGALLSDRGVLAIQIPQFRDLSIGRAIQRVAQTDRWRLKMGHCAELFTYHDYNFYYRHLSREFASTDLWETSYVHVLESRPAIIEWTKSTGMRPYLDSLNSDSEKREFEEEVLAEIELDYPLQEDGRVLFTFKRLFVVGYRVR